jgi:hypothetical protein
MNPQKFCLISPLNLALTKVDRLIFRHSPSRVPSNEKNELPVWGRNRHVTNIRFRASNFKLPNICVNVLRHLEGVISTGLVNTRWI